jgi:predicted MFS family arabinose efflux permease
VALALALALALAVTVTVTATAKPTDGSPGHSDDSRAEARAVAVLVSLLTLGLLDAQLLAPILAAVAESLAVSESSVGTTVTGYALAAAVAALVVGPLSDRYGRKRFLVGAGLAFALGSLLVSRAVGLYDFGVARVLTGASAGVLSALVVSAIADAVPYERRGRAMGWVAAAYFAAPVLGVPVAAWIADGLGWRTNYWVLTVFGVGLAALVHLGIQESARSTTSARAAAAVGRNPIGRYLGYLRRRSTAACALSAFFVTGGLTGFLLFLGAYLQHRFSLSLTQVGLVFLLCGIASLVGAFSAGRISDRVGKLPLALGGCVGLATVLLALPFAEGAVLYFILALVGLTAASRVAPLQSLVTELVSAEDRGAYVALRNTLSQCGNASAAAVAAVVYPYGFEYVCWLAAGFSAAAFGLLLLIEEPSRVEVDPARV